MKILGVFIWRNNKSQFLTLRFKDTFPVSSTSSQRINAYLMLKELPYDQLSCVCEVCNEIEDAD